MGIRGAGWLMLAAGCGGYAAEGTPFLARHVATTGEVFQTDIAGTLVSQVLKTSAANDLKCPIAEVRTSAAGRSQFLGEGCGQRVLYRSLCTSLASDDPADGDGHDTAPVDPRTRYVCRYKILSRTTLDR